MALNAGSETLGGAEQIAEPVGALQIYTLQTLSVK